MPDPKLLAEALGSPGSPTELKHRRSNAAHRPTVLVPIGGRVRMISGYLGR